MNQDKLKPIKWEASRSPLIKWERRHDLPNGYKYRALNTVTRTCPRSNKTLTVTEGDLSDGATSAWDIKSDSWGFHDKACATGVWDDGTKLCNLEASLVASDILWSEGREVRSIRWFFATLAFGGGEARKNGMLRVRG